MEAAQANRQFSESFRPLKTKQNQQQKPHIAFAPNTFLPVA